MDDLNKKGAGDRSKINMHEDYEVKYWTKQLGVSRDELERRSTRLETRPQPFARNWAANAGWTKGLPDNRDKFVRRNLSTTHSARGCHPCLRLRPVTYVSGPDSCVLAERVSDELLVSAVRHKP
jgi:hypothetical protein